MVLWARPAQWNPPRTAIPYSWSNLWVTSSEENLRQFAALLDAMEAHDLGIWIYDEDGYPSGQGGGLAGDGQAGSGGGAGHGGGGTGFGGCFGGTGSWIRSLRNEPSGWGI